MSELKDCPFCGTPVRHDDLVDCLHPTRNGWQMCCNPCYKGCEATVYADTKEDAIAAWNRRAPVPQEDALPDGWLAVMAEVARATEKFPTWPTDALHAVAVLGEEFGELTKAVLQATYEPHKSTPDDARTEAVQTAAMALRFLASLDAYAYERCEQHKQLAEGKSHLKRAQP